ncbi:hypothetical protein VPH35_012661 [Triticum aestivum]|uniref:Late embryogenesis abundant protein LEA-2 subgroup domain-containing protein n=1 Tax=Aegilops tauschii subsp. strangulata TaxID=200361 RepID=A0A452XP90_AEGTS
MATIRSLRKRWRAKQYISAAMLGTLFAVALVAATSISLAPARMRFSVVKAEIVTYRKPPTGPDTNTHLNLNLVANNTSQRTAVWFDSMSTEIWYGPAATAWVRTKNAWLPTGWQPPRSLISINMSIDYGYVPNSDATDYCRVVVKSKVFFRFGLASTRPFTIKFSCLNVNFVDNTSLPVVCG